MVKFPSMLDGGEPEKHRFIQAIEPPGGPCIRPAPEMRLVPEQVENGDCPGPR